MVKFNRRQRPSQVSKSGHSESSSDMLGKLKALISSPSETSLFISQIELSDLEVDALSSLLEYPSKLVNRVIMETPLLLELMPKTRQARSQTARHSFVQIFRNVISWVEPQVVENLVRSKRLIDFVGTSIVDDLHSIANSRSQSLSNQTALESVLEAELLLLADIRECFPPSDSIVSAGFLTPLCSIALNPCYSATVRLAACKAVLGLTELTEDVKIHSANPELNVHLEVLTGSKIPKSMFASVLDGQFDPFRDLNSIIKRVLAIKPVDKELAKHDEFSLKTAQGLITQWNCAIRALSFSLTRCEEEMFDRVEGDDQLEELPFSVGLIPLGSEIDTSVILRCVIALFDSLRNACDAQTLQTLLDANLPEMLWEQFYFLMECFAKAVAVAGVIIRMRGLSCGVDLVQKLVESVPNVLSCASLIDEAMADLLNELAATMLTCSVMGNMINPMEVIRVWQPVFVLPSETFAEVQVLIITLIRSLPSELLLSETCAAAVLTILETDGFTSIVISAAMDLFFDVFGTDLFDQVLSQRNWRELLGSVVDRLQSDSSDEDERERIAGVIENTKAFISYKSSL